MKRLVPWFVSGVLGIVVLETIFNIMLSTRPQTEDLPSVISQLPVGFLGGFLSTLIWSRADLARGKDFSQATATMFGCMIAIIFRDFYLVGAGWFGVDLGMVAGLFIAYRTVHKKWKNAGSPELKSLF